MAQRWKLVPTLRHKQCPNTMCGVYIGNGCRKCPKCNTVQPPCPKRKRTSSPAKPRKKKVPQADGNPSATYRKGDRVKVFWERYKRWTWGKISAVYDTSNSSVSGRTYAVQVFGLRDGNLAGPWGEWHLQYVPNTHLKRRLTDDDLAMNTVRSDVLYKDIVQVKSELGPPGLHHLKEAVMPYPTCACIPCMRKYYNAIFLGPKRMHKNLQPLKKGTIIRTNVYNSYDTLMEVIGFNMCRNPDFSSVMVRNCEPDSRNFTATSRLNPKDKWYHYTIHFEDNGKQRYFHDTTAHFQERIYTLCDEADEICNQDMSSRANNKIPAKDAFDYDMNNFTYRIELEVYTQVRTDSNGNKHKYRYWEGSQTNTKTNVKRTLYIGSLKKPVEKKLVDYKAKIENVIGNSHHWQWLDADTARADPLFSGVKHPNSNRLKFLGATKFHKDFVDLDKRMDFYKTFAVSVRQERLFHGTYMRNLFPILHPLGGFAMASESNGKCYGQGIYFAESPDWVYDNGYCPASSVDNIRCVLICDVLLGKKLIHSTDTWHKHASVRGNTSEIGSGASDDGVTFKPSNFELTGGSTTRNIHVVWYDKCRTDINIKGVLFYK